MGRGTLSLGTSGFAYAEWRGDFYPADLKSDAMLPFYAGRFTSVEINYTFQRNPIVPTVERWVSQTPEGFAFSLKAHRRITHERRLTDVGEPLAFFLSSVERLGRRLGAVLFQCPPSLAADLGRLEAFLALLPQDRRFAMEFRHPSWNTGEVKEGLAKRGVAWCVADTDDADAPLERTAPGFAYLRLRKTAYDDESLARWAEAIAETLDDGADVYCYFKHEAEGRGLDFARALQALVG